MAAAGLAVIAVTYVLLPPQQTLGGLFAVPPVVAALMVIAGAQAAPNSPAARLLSCGPAVLIGKLSYSWYLWHWPLLALARIGTAERDQGRDLAIALGALALAGLTYVLVEQPIRQRRPGPFASRWGAISAGAAMLILCGAAGAGLYAGGYAWLARSPKDQALRAAATAHWPISLDCTGAMGPRFSADHCALGPKDADLTVLLVGDSHAQHLIAGLDAAAKAARVRVIVWSSGGCRPYLRGPSPLGPLANAGERQCAAFNEAIRAQLPRLIREERLGAVIASARWQHDPQWKDNLVTLAKGWQARGLTVVLTHDTANYPRDALVCLAHQPAATCAVTRARATADRAIPEAPLDRQLAADPAIMTFDPLDSLCGAALCPVVDGQGRILYRDHHHLTVDGSAALAPALTALLNDIRAARQPLRQ